MKKRSLALFLAILMTVNTFSGTAIATGDDSIPSNSGTTTESATTEPETGGADESAAEDTETPTEGSDTSTEGSVTSTEGELAADYSADVGKYAQLIPDPEDIETGGMYNVRSGVDGEDVLLFYYTDFKEGTIFRITNWCLDYYGLWYQVEFFSGGVVEDSTEYWPKDSWILQDYLDGSGIFSVKFIPCPVCGGEDCTAEHVQCPVCGEYDCPLSHAYCGVCGALDCGTEHIYCELCKGFDCGVEHEELPDQVWMPSTVPVIPENPQLPDTYDVAVLDDSGLPVDGDSGLLLGWMDQASLSAWSALGEQVSYQWQIYISDGDGFWVDITGQTGKGLLFSRAMLTSALDESGSTWLRCITASEDSAMTSEAIRVTVDLPEENNAEDNNENNVQNITVANAEENSGEEPVLFAIPMVRQRSLSAVPAPAAADTVTITILYLEHGKPGVESAVTNPYVATIPAGEPFNQTILAPSRPGYAPFWDVNGDGFLWTGADYYNIADATFSETGGTAADENAEEMTLDLKAEETRENRVYRVYYLPVEVNVGIRYFFQNLYDDGYTENTEWYHQDRMRTGTIVTEEYLKSHAGDTAGFTRMVHQSEPVAADGSTVFECYYDREYFMLQFSLSGGYGVEPVYARYETPVSVPNPTRPGWTFAGWDLMDRDSNGDGTPDAGDGTAEPDGLPGTVPAENRRYIALWTKNPAGVNYTVVYWREDADPQPDGTYEYSFWGSETKNALAGTIVHGDDFKDVPDSVSHAEIDGKDVDEELFFTYNAAKTNENGKDVEVKGDGSTIVNVYYTRNSYTILFKGYGTCYLDEHEHTDDCNIERLVCGLEEHTHTDACGTPTISCGKEEHIAHTTECLNCGKDAHTHTGCALKCDHKDGHLLECYKLAGGSWTSQTNKPVGIDVETPVDGEIYQFSYYYKTYYYLYLDGLWYSRSNQDYYNGTITKTCTHTHADTCYDCGEEAHSHTVTCYEDALHTHTAACYNYPNCDDVEHVHSDSCWDACTLIEHTHVDTYQQDCKENDTDNIIYVLTAKYNADISALWPTYDVLKSNSTHYQDSDGNVENGNGTPFRGWSGFGNTAVSKRVNMTSDLCDTSSGRTKTATASYDTGTTYYLFYLFESPDQSSGEVAADFDAGTARYQHSNGKYYDSDPAYYQVLSLSGNLNPKEIMGMTPVSTSSVPTVNIDGKNCKLLYYDRTEHMLRFQSHGVFWDEYTATVKYGMPLAGYAPTEDPSYPSTLEPGAYLFDGWYTTPDCVPGTEATFATDTMPNSDMTYYASWVPETHEVIFFRHYEYLEAWEKDSENPNPAIPTDGMIFDTVPHGHLVDPDKMEHVLNWTYQLGTGEGEVLLVGFFYMEDGQKRAFDPQNIPVTKDLKVYAEWRGQAEQPYRVEYVLKTDPATAVAEPTTGYSRVGILRTFSAKAGNDLAPAYRDKAYFPLTSSHSMVVKPEEDKDVAVENVHRFEYVQATNVPYTVLYLEQGTDAELLPAKVISTNTDAIVTEGYMYKEGYVPDAFYKKLVLSVIEDEEKPGTYIGDDQKNVIIFYYTKSKTDAPYAVHHMLENLDGDGYEEVAFENGIAAIGASISITPRSYQGFAPNEKADTDPNVTGGEVSLTDGKYTFKVQKNGSELYIYYDRNSYEYKVHFYLEGTTTPVLDSLEKTERFGIPVTEEAPRYTEDKAYKLISENPKTHVMSAGLNEIIFYYQPIEYRVQYIAVPDQGGTFTQSSEIARGGVKFQGTEPKPATNYKFIGWYLDEACTNPVTDTQATLDADKHLTPKLLSDSTGNPITEYTFYAKFELQTAQYQVHFYLEETTTPVMPSLEGTERLGISVTKEAPQYTQDKVYKLISESPKTHVMSAGPNEIIFYYRPIEYKAQYIAVPVQGGTFTLSSEIAHGDVKFQGTEPKPATNYKFIGWYLDEECTVPVTGGQATLGADNHLTPKLLSDSTGNPITEYKFYAKFELQAADFTITRTNAKAEQVFVYRVAGNGLTIDVTVEGNGSVTIADLPFGEYTVEQLNDWSWRYADGSQTVIHSKESHAGVQFDDDISVQKWLSGVSNFLKNIVEIAH